MTAPSPGSSPRATRPRPATRCCCGSCCGPWRPTGCGPPTRTPARSPRSGRGPCPAWCSSGCGGCPRRAPPSRGRSRSSATARACRRSPPSPGSTSRPPRRRSRRSRGPRWSGTSTRSGSCTRSCATRSTRTCRPGSGSCTTSAPLGSSAGCRRRRSRSPRTCCRSRNAPTSGSSTCCGPRPTRRCTGARPRAPPRTCAGPWPSRPRRSSDRRCCWRSGRSRRSTTARPRSRTCGPRTTTRSPTRRRSRRCRGCSSTR